MPYDGMMFPAARSREHKTPKVGRPARDRRKNKAQRQARKRTR